MGDGIPLLYGSTTGNTAGVAQRIVELWRGVEPIACIDIADSDLTDLIKVRCLIIGAPTWNFGELQEDWADAWDAFCMLDFSGKRVAIFGVGDQLGYPEWFQDAMGLIANQVTTAGGEIVGAWPADSYDFESSLALTDDGKHFVGLALDEDSQSWATDERLEEWLELVRSEFS